MKIEYDHDADALYVYLTSSKQKIAKTREIEDGVMLDLNKKGEVLGIELIGVSKRFKPKELMQFSVKHLGGKAIAA